MQNSKPPTQAELTILSILWTRGRSTVREVLENAPKERDWGYTTVLKLMQLMKKKNLVDRDTTKYSHVYWAKLSQNRAKKNMLKQLINQVFNQSSSELVLHALQEKMINKEELAKIKNLIRKLEKSED